MIRPLVTYPDAVLVAIDYLRTCLPDAAVFSEVPTPRPTEFVRVRRLGGTSPTPVTDRPRLDFECWSDTEENAEGLCSSVRSFALSMAGSREGTTVYNVQEVSGPMWLPDDTSGQPRYSFAMEFTTRGTRKDSA